MMAKTMKCDFCHKYDDDDLIYGKFYQWDNITTHYFCLLLSSNATQRGTDKQGIMGFMGPEIRAELKRGKRLKCTYCKKTGATLGCCGKGCTRTFHLPCGIEKGAVSQFFGQFKSFCSEHAPTQVMTLHELEQLSTQSLASESTCGICYENVTPCTSYYTLWANCCGHGWYHRQCMQKLAVTAGKYFFKCPLCSNNDRFVQEMQRIGIYVPIQDAAWETEPQAFEDLLYRPNTCEAEPCKCPHGRDYTKDNTIWSIAICTLCGAVGVHYECKNLSKLKPNYQCGPCIEALHLKNKAEMEQLQDSLDQASPTHTKQAHESLESGEPALKKQKLDEPSSDNDSDVSLNVIDDIPERSLKSAELPDEMATDQNTSSDPKLQVNDTSNESDSKSTTTCMCKPESDSKPPSVCMCKPESDSKPPPMCMCKHESDSKQSSVCMCKPESDSKPPPMCIHESDSKQSSVCMCKPESDSKPPPMCMCKHESDSKQSSVCMCKPESDSKPPPMCIHESDSKPPAKCMCKHESDSKPPAKCVCKPESDSKPPALCMCKHESDSQPPSVCMFNPESDSKPPPKCMCKHESDSKPPATCMCKPESDSKPPSVCMCNPVSDSKPPPKCMCKHESDSKAPATCMCKPESDSKPPSVCMCNPESDSKPPTCMCKHESDSSSPLTCMCKHESDSNPPLACMCKPESDSKPPPTCMCKHVSDSKPPPTCICKPESKPPPMCMYTLRARNNSVKYYVPKIIYRKRQSMRGKECSNISKENNVSSHLRRRSFPINSKSRKKYMEIFV